MRRVLYRRVGVRPTRALWSRAAPRRRPFRTQPDRPAAPGQPAHRAAGLADGPRRRSALPAAHRGPRRRPGARALVRAAARRSGGARPRLGRPRGAPVRARLALPRSPRAPARERPPVRVLVHARGDPGRVERPAGRAPRRCVPRHVPGPDGGPATRARSPGAPTGAARERAGSAGGVRGPGVRSDRRRRRRLRRAAQRRRVRLQPGRGRRRRRAGRRRGRPRRRPAATAPRASSGFRRSSACPPLATRTSR